MKTIKILGTGCPKCKTTFNNATEAVNQSGIAAEIVKVEDIMEIMEYNVMSTPALLIDDVVHVKGRVAEIAEIEKLLRQ